MSAGRPGPVQPCAACAFRAPQERAAGSAQPVYLRVSAELRREIIGTFQGASAEDIEAAFEASREHLATEYGALPRDYQLAKEYVDDLQCAWRCDVKSSLESMLRDNKHASFLIAFARLVDVDYDLVSRLVDAKDVDVPGAALLPGGLRQEPLHHLCMMRSSAAGLVAMERRQLYEQVPVVAAQRAAFRCVGKSGAEQDLAGR